MGQDEGAWVIYALRDDLNVADSSPPFVLASEEAMIRFVASTPGAVGYVSLCLADKRVAVVATIEGGPGCSK